MQHVPTAKSDRLTQQAAATIVDWVCRTEMLTEPKGDNLAGAIEELGKYTLDVLGSKSLVRFRATVQDEKVSKDDFAALPAACDSLVSMVERVQLVCSAKVLHMIACGDISNFETVCLPKRLQPIAHALQLASSSVAPSGWRGRGRVDGLVICDFVC